MRSSAPASFVELTGEFGAPGYERFEAAATPPQKRRLAEFSPRQIRSSELAGEKIQAVLTRAPHKVSPIGGVKVVAASGWFAARPPGTEDMYKIYPESFRGTDHLWRIVSEAQVVVSGALGASGS